VAKSDAMADMDMVAPAVGVRRGGGAHDGWTSL
jgi:hypothetical protein